MENFFGFIDYKKEELVDVDYNELLYQEERLNFNIYISCKKSNRVTTLNNPDIFIVIIGRVSNCSELKRLLNIDSNLSTVEIIEEAYIEWGLEFIKRVEGSLAIILYNKNREELTLIKDRVGKVPINYYESDSKIIFSSSIKRFKEVSTFTPAINPNSLASYLQFGSILQPNTILKECYKVKSGYYKSFNLKKKESKEQEYWRLEECYSKPKINSSEDTVIENAHQLLIDSIEKDYLEDREVSSSLSGGYDSATIASLLQERSSKKINTFTIGFSEQEINEAKDAKKIAKHIGTEHHEHYFTGRDAIDIIPKLSKIYDEPFAEYAGTPTILTAELIKQNNIEDIFVGDGGDEVFATADDTEFFQHIHKIPQNIRETLCSLFKKIPIEKIPYLENFHNLPTKYRKLFNLLSAKNISKSVESKNILFREDELQLLVKEYTTPMKTTFDEINFKGYHETVDEIIGTYFKTTMTDGELVKSYGAMNYYNINLNTPFLDKKLIAYMATVPSSIKIKNGIKKYILKEIAYQYIPKDLLDRPKSGFDIPFSSWMRNELKELVYAHVNEKRLNEDKLFYTYFIINIRDSFYQGNDSYKYKLWRIFIFQLWYKNFKG